MLGKTILKASNSNPMSNINPPPKAPMSIPTISKIKKSTKEGLMESNYQPFLMPLSNQYPDNRMMMNTGTVSKTQNNEPKTTLTYEEACKKAYNWNEISTLYLSYSIYHNTFMNLPNLPKLRQLLHLSDRKNHGNWLKISPARKTVRQQFHREIVQANWVLLWSYHQGST